MSGVKGAAGALALVGTLLGSAGGGAAFPVGSGVHTVRDDPGGHVIEYAIAMKRIERDQRAVRFDGRCDSACTIYLALPASHTCVTPRAMFGFHLPYGSSARGNRVAADYLLKSYPEWVHSWIEAHGGLTSELKVMPYEYASQHMETCIDQLRPVQTAAR